MYQLDSISEAEKQELTFNLMSILEGWDISDKEQVVLLALPDDFKSRGLYLYRKGDKSFDYTQHSLARAQALVGIYEALSTTYPSNRNYGAIWLKRPMKKFDKQTPLNIMLSGDTGIKRIWHFLDCTQSWD